MKTDRYSRRTLLKAMGLGAGFLPLLEAERALAASATGYPTRLISITWTNGIVPNAFYPEAGALTGALPAILSPLEQWKSKVLAFRTSNGAKSPFDFNVMIDANQRYGGHSAYPAVLTGTWQSARASNGPSIDQLIANQLTTQGVRSPLLNLGCRPYQSSTSWKAAGQKNTAVTDPAKVFSSLFTGVPTTPGMAPPPTGGGPSTLDALRKRRKSVLDFVTGELNSYSSRLGADDKQKIESHLDAVRELEAKLDPSTNSPSTPVGPGVAVGTSCAAPTLTSFSNSNVNDYPKHVANMMALAGAAVKCDFARCITLDLIDDGGGNSLTYPWLGINSPDYHAIAHQGSGGYPNKTKIDTWFYSQVAALVKDLADTPEGTGSVLDNTCILISNDMSEGAAHFVGNIPYLIIGSCGGFFKTGVSVSFPKNVPNNHLLTTVCHAMGLEVPMVGAANYAGDIDSLVRA